MTESKQVQKSGDGSFNAQVAGNLVVGISYEDARQIALDVYKNNFIELSENAAITARERAEEITSKFFDKLFEEYPEGIKQAEEPSFQRALYNVQKQYAYSGDNLLGDILVDILIDRTKYKERTIEQLVLNEALITIPKLTNQQIAALSIVFIIRRTNLHEINTIDEIVKLLSKTITPFLDNLTDNNICYLHLEYASCGSIDTLPSKIHRYLMKGNEGLFTKGFEKEQVEEIDISEEVMEKIIVECYHAKNKYRLNAINHAGVTELFNELRICDDTKAKLLNLNDSVKMNDDEIKQLFIKKDERMGKLFDIWEKSYLKNFNLTSVGITIGHANVKKVLGSFNDLSIWINE